MRKVIHRMYFIWQHEEEERWLNEMAAQGMNLVDASLCRYVFEPGTPGEYQYRLEMMEHCPSHPKVQEYMRFMEEAGAEVVATFKNWVYFRGRAGEENFRIFSDIDSRITHYRGIHKLARMLWWPPLLAGLANMVIGISQKSVSNAVIGVACCVFGILILLGNIRLWKKLDALKKERSIHE